MARYVGPVCRLCRRESAKLFLKGERCYSEKCAIERRNYSPGQHGQGRSKLSDYGIQLREKQKTKRIYHVLEKSFRSDFHKAERMRGVTGELLLQRLEHRLDNAIYKSGLVSSRKQARQLILHKHFKVNDRTVNIPSYRLSVGDVVAVRDKSKTLKVLAESVENVSKKVIPAWMETDTTSLLFSVKAKSSREDVGYEINEQLIVELYSK